MSRLTRGPTAGLPVRGSHPLWPSLPGRSGCQQSATGLFRFRSPLLAESLLMSFPPGTEMFQFPGFASRTYEFSARSPCGGVTPFGHPRINDRSHLPAAFRSVPRPSSPLGAKASTKCPLMLDAPISRRRSPARAENRRIPHATPSLFGPGPRRLEFSLKTRRPSHTPDHENDRPNGPASPRLMRRRSTYPLHDIIQQARPSGLATGRRVQDAAPDLGQTVICLLDHAPNPGAPDPAVPVGAIPVGAIPVGATPVTPANPGEPGGGGRD